MVQRPPATTSDAEACGVEAAAVRAKELRPMELHERLSTQPPRPAGPEGAVRGAQEPGAHASDREPRPPDLRPAARRGGAARTRCRRGPHAAERPRRLSRATTASALISEIADDIVGYGPLERLLADDSVTEIMVNGPTDIWIERQGRALRDDGAVRRRLAPAAHHQQDRRADRAPRRRGVADGGRAPARRQPRQRDHPAALAERAAAHDPQVLQAAG